MLQITIPGFKKLELNHLVLDYNGTLAIDGEMIDGVGERLNELSGRMTIHILTADTFGKVRQKTRGLPCKIAILPAEEQHIGKLNYIKNLHVKNTVCIGNGRNDRLMLREAALGIAVMQSEGIAAETLQAADVVTKDIIAALELLLKPLRLTATLRS